MTENVHTSELGIGYACDNYDRPTTEYESRFVFDILIAEIFYPILDDF